MDNIGSFQIGHSSVKEADFKMLYEGMCDRHVEVSFSHRHFFYAIYWIHEGNGIHVIDFKEYEIQPDRVFFIRPEQIHFLQGSENLRYSAVQFTEDFMASVGGVMQKEIAVFKDLTSGEKERIGVLFRQLYLESVGGLLNSMAMIQSEIKTLLLELERLSISVKNVVSTPLLIQEYKDLIERNFVNDRRVQIYAKTLGVTPNYLNVLTRRHLGKSALELINERMMLEVKRQLLRTEDGVSEIAYKLGFNELSYFSRFFKKHTGMTPLEFRVKMNKMYQK